MLASNLFFRSLKSVQEKVLEPCGISCTEVLPEHEGKAYGAGTLAINQMQVRYRVAKITPTKIGQFVAIWKRDSKGLAAPFDVADNFDFLIINCVDRLEVGLFIFPKQILLQSDIISGVNRKGKRGIRVYPFWDKTENKQAQKTQAWQLDYFLHLTGANGLDVDRAKKLLGV